MAYADYYEDLGYEEAEGAAEALDAMDYYEDELEAADEWEAEDEMEYEFEAEDMYEFEADEWESYDGYEADEFEEDAMEDVLAFALSAEDEDEFWGKLFKGIKNVAGKVGGFVRKAAPYIGKAARLAGPILSKIPHPYAQIAGKAAGLLGKLRAEGASEEEALEAFAEMAVRDKRAIPIVAGLTARSVLKSTGARMPFPVRKKMVKGITNATKALVRKQGPAAVRALPKIAKSVKRTAAVKGTPPAARPTIVKRTALKVAKSPMLAKKLSKPSPTAVRLVKGVGGARSYTIPGPARITISAV